MKITELDAQNIKGLKHVNIRPTGSMVAITGANAQGKTSVMDAVWLAFGGRAALAATPEPVHHGEDTAEIRIELDDGELVVTRRFTAGGANTTLKVTKDGMRAEKGQAALDALLGNMAFDPLAWLNQPASAQRETLLGLIDLPFDLVELDAQRQELYDERTVVNREVKTMESRVSGMPAAPDGTPDEETSAQDVIAEVTRLRNKADLHASVRQALSEAAENRSAAKAKVDGLRSLLIEAEEELVLFDARLLEAQTEANALSTTAAEDQTAVQVALDQFESIGGINEAVRAKRARDAAIAELTAKAAEADSLTDQMAAIDRRKRTALAEAAMPIEGLSVSEDGVFYNDRPLKNCSTSERIRVSAAMAMAGDPAIRIIRIANGNELDSANLELLGQLAEERGFQVWIEIVDETGDLGFYIEAGEVITTSPNPITTNG